MDNATQNTATAQINPSTATTASASSTAETDYKALYEKATAEVEKQKKLKDDYAKENAEYKRKAQEAMTDEQKKAEAEAEREKAFNAMQAELAEIKLEKEILANGFTADEANALKGLKIPQEAIKPIAELIKARLDEYKTSVATAGIKQTTPQQTMGVGTATKSEKSDFQKYQESRKKQAQDIKF